MRKAGLPDKVRQAHDTSMRLQVQAAPLKAQAPGSSSRSSNRHMHTQSCSPGTPLRSMCLAVKSHATQHSSLQHSCLLADRPRTFHSCLMLSAPPSPFTSRQPGTCSQCTNEPCTPVMGYAGSTECHGTSKQVAKQANTP